MIKIQECMTSSPHTINADKTLEYAKNKMHELGIRHLPVMQASRLLGMVSDSDIKLIESFDRTELDEIKVIDAFTNEPFVVDVESPLSEVCANMAEKKIGSAMVTQNDKLVGIFTWIDALKYLGKQK